MDNFNHKYSSKIVLLKLTGQIIGLFLGFSLIIFFSAGQITWIAGWIFLLIFFGFVIGMSAWLIKNNPDLLQERMKGAYQKEQKIHDRIIILITSILFVVWLIIMPADAVRYHTTQIPVLFQEGGAIILFLSLYFFFLTFKANSYLSPAIRNQDERGQVVISTGPYQYIRHPMYGAFILFVIGTSLLLGSGYGLIIGAGLIVMVAIRAIFEENMLCDELPGYSAYMEKVKYRLIPFIW